MASILQALLISPPCTGSGSTWTLVDDGSRDSGCRGEQPVDAGFARLHGQAQSVGIAADGCFDPPAVGVDRRLRRLGNHGDCPKATNREARAAFAERRCGFVPASLIARSRRSCRRSGRGSAGAGRGSSGLPNRLSGSSLSRGLVGHRREVRLAPRPRPGSSRSSCRRVRDVGRVGGGRRSPRFRAAGHLRLRSGVSRDTRKGTTHAGLVPIAGHATACHRPAGPGRPPRRYPVS